MYFVISAALIVFGLATGAAHADDEEERLAAARKEWAIAAVKLGLGLTRAAIAGSSTGFPPSDQPVSAQKQALMEALSDYQRDKAQAHGHVAAFRVIGDFAVNGTAAMLTATGVGAVPAAIVKGGGQLVVDVVMADFQEGLKTALDTMLVKKKDQLLQIAGVSYEQLQAQTPAQMKTTLESSTAVFGDMEQLMAGDPNGLEMAKDLFVQGIANTQRATLVQLQATTEQLDKVEQNVAKLSTDFVRFRDTTTVALEMHTEAIDELQGAVGTLQVSMTKVEARLDVQERNGAVVADFVFAQMPAKAKVAALESGFLGERFACPDGGTDCEQAQLKADLIERFETEADMQDRVDALGKTAQGLSDAAQLASNLGISVPGLGEAAGVAGVVAGAYAQFATGNVLGAMTAVSGLFAKRTDPDQARFQAMMGYLEQEFTQLNKKLDAILENQQKLMQAIVDLSEQVARQYRALDERLARMEFELDRVSQGVRMEVWEELQPCANVHDWVRQHAGELGLDALAIFRVSMLFAVQPVPAASPQSTA